jgi:hypothetical protein
MKTCAWKAALMAGAVVLFLAAGGTGAFADLNMDYNDMWDVTAPHTDRVTITNSGPVGLIFPADRSFGHAAGTGDSNYNTIFGDSAAAGTMHYVEWQCQTPVTLAEFHLFASRDWINGHWNRQFSEFNLYYWDNTAWQLIKHLDTDALYGQYDPSIPGFLAVAVNDFAPVSAARFRYEVEQTATSQYNWLWGGPRVCELDGYSSVVIPLPGAVWLLGSGLLGLAGLRFRKP